MSAQKLPAINHRSCKSFALSNDLWLLTLMSWKRCESQTVDNSTTRSEFGSYHGHNSTNICCICDELNLRGIGIFVGNFCCHQNCRELPSCCGLLPLNIAQCSYLKKGKRRRLCKNHISRHFSLLIIPGNILNDWPWGNPCHRTVRMYRSSISKKSQTRRAGIPCFWYRKLLNPIQELLKQKYIGMLSWQRQVYPFFPDRPKHFTRYCMLITQLTEMGILQQSVLPCVCLFTKRTTSFNFICPTCLSLVGLKSAHHVQFDPLLFLICQFRKVLGTQLCVQIVLSNALSIWNLNKVKIPHPVQCCHNVARGVCQNIAIDILRAYKPSIRL